MTRGWHPWRALRAQTGVQCDVADLPPGVLGLTDHAGQRIEYARDMLQRERRVVLAHELVHLERGPVCPSGVAREEAAVEQEAARRLIPIDELAAALAWTRDIEELAEELWVDAALVRVRCAHLHPAERHYVRRCLARTEETA